MSGTFERLLARYGQSVLVCYGDGRPDRAARAFFQRLTERREDWRQEEPTPLGMMRQERFLYFGEPEVPLESGSVLLWKGRPFQLRAWEPIYVGEKLNHWWAVAVAQ